MTRNLQVEIGIEEVERLLREAVGAPDDAYVTMDPYDGVTIAWAEREPLHPDFTPPDQVMRAGDGE